VSLEDAIRLTPGRSLLLLRVGQYKIEGIFWDALASQESTGPRNKIWTRARNSLVSSQELLKSDIAPQLLAFAKRVHLAEGVVVPRSLSRVIAALMPRREVDQWAMLTGQPELADFDQIIMRLEFAYRNFQNERTKFPDSHGNSLDTRLRGAASQFSRVHQQYYDTYKERPPKWLFEHLTPEYRYPYDGPFDDVGNMRPSSLWSRGYGPHQ
jgi:hypothetical protein